MNADYSNSSAVAEWIARLMQEPYFQDGTLTMYAQVPVKCLQYVSDYCDERENLCSAPDKYRYDAFDFLVCRGNHVAATICFNNGSEEGRMKELFGSYLAGLDCIARTAEAFDTFELEEFYPLAVQHLSQYAQADAFRSDYALETKVIDADFLTLKQNCLLEEDGLAPVFHRDCGIFYRCYIDEDGLLGMEPVTCTRTFPEQVRALSWKSEVNEDTVALQKLLDMPLAEFCGKNRARLIEFQAWLSAFSGELKGFPAITMASAYRDFLKACSDCRYRPAHAFPNRKAVLLVMAKLKKHLAEVIRDEDFSFFQIPLHRYYTAAANLADCYYPLWLYRNIVRPHLCNQPEDFFTMSWYAGYSHAHLTDLMVEPICVPGREEI